MFLFVTSIFYTEYNLDFLTKKEKNNLKICFVF